MSAAPSPQGDPRVTIAKAGAPAAHACVVSAAPIRRTPQDDGAMDDQLLFGDGFDVHTVKDGWAWGQAGADRYVGHVRLDHLCPGAPAPTHRVAALRAYAFAAPDLKSPPLALLSLNARVEATVREGRFLHARGAGWMFAGHLAGLDAPFPADHAGAAQRFLGAPYLWGGKESVGLDCSGLVQSALRACGHDSCPRDADQQEAALGTPVAFDAARSGPAPGLARGDLVFWPGHVGIMLDADTLIHANAHHMEVAAEPLREARDRIAANGAPIRSIRRLCPLS